MKTKLIVCLLLACAPSFAGDTVTLREYVDMRFQAQDRAVQAALAAVKEENQKTERTMEKRFEGVNEFRKALEDNTKTFLPRPEYTGAHQALVEKIELNTKRVDEIVAKNMGLNQGWLILVGIIGVAGTVYAIYRNRNK